MVSVRILTSMFQNGFQGPMGDVLLNRISKRNRFAFIASEFENRYEKTDKYFRVFLEMFEDIGIHFEEAYVVDGRMSAHDAQRAAAEADVVWLSGGDTLRQIHYFQKYGLINVLKHHAGIIIGMSAGSINMAETAICTMTCGHYKQEIYRGLGCVNISVEPHFIRDNVSMELLDLSEEYTIYGLCDESFIVCSGEKTEFYGDVYKISLGNIEKM